MVTRERLQRDQRRAATRGALVLEAAAKQLELLAEPELADRAVGDGALAVVGAAGLALDLVGPLLAQIGEVPLAALLGESLGLRGCLLKVQLDESPLSERWGGPT
jgi:hypothetical protein